MLRQIIYISTARTPVAGTLLADIERAAQRNNRRGELSGLLLFDGVRFLQVIEGPPDRLEPAMRTIRADPRHFGLVLLRDRTVETRAFPQWAMLCRRTDGQTGLAELVAKHMTGADPTTRALFESFAEIRDKAA